MVARPKPEQRRGAVAKMGEDELARGAVRELDRGARVGVDQLRVHEAAGAEVHAVLLLALTPERRTDVADAHRLRHARAPSLLEPRAECGLPSAGLSGDEHPLHRRSAQVEVALGRPLDEVRRVRRRQHDGIGPELLDREHQPLGVPGPDRDVSETDPVERAECRAGHERPGVVGRDDALAGANAGCGVAPRRAGDPVVEVAGRERDVARRPGRPARRVDADDLGRLRAEVGAERVLRRAARAELVLLGEREARDLLQPACGFRGR